MVCGPRRQGYVNVDAEVAWRSASQPREGRARSTIFCVERKSQVLELRGSFLQERQRWIGTAVCGRQAHSSVQRFGCLCRFAFERTTEARFNAQCRRSCCSAWCSRGEYWRRAYRPTVVDSKGWRPQANTNNMILHQRPTALLDIEGGVYNNTERL